MDYKGYLINSVEAELLHDILLTQQEILAELKRTGATQSDSAKINDELPIDVTEPVETPPTVEEKPVQKKPTQRKPVQRKPSNTTKRTSPKKNK